MIDISIISAFIPYILGAVIIFSFMKPIMKWMKKNKKSKKVQEARSDSDRLYLGKKKACKSSGLMRRKEVWATGDEGVPESKLGETCWGILPGNDEYVMFLKKKWWQFWKDPLCLRVEPELVGDLNTGDKVILKGKALDPATDRYTYLSPPSQFYDDIKVDKVHRRRSKVGALKHKRLLNIDINEDRGYVVKHALRGGSKKAMKEIYMPSEPPTEKKEEAKRKKKRKAKEMRREYEEDNSRSESSQFMQGGDEF